MKTLIVSNLNKEVLAPNHFNFSNQSAKIAEQILKSDKFDHLIIVNDRHSEGCDEFKFMPPHGFDNRAPIWFDKKYTLLNKTSFSVIGNDYAKKNIIGRQNLYLAGFHIETDILASVMDFIKYGQEITIIQDWCVEYKESVRQTVLELFRWLNFKVVGSEEIV